MNKTTSKITSKTTSNETTNPSGIAGKIALGEGVVEKIAGLVAREIPGIHSIGKSSIIPFGDKDRRGVEAEVGEVEAALDLEAVIDYGVDVQAVVTELRGKLAEQVTRMTGLVLVEVNINVVGIHLPEDDARPAHEERRVH